MKKKIYLNIGGKEFEHHNYETLPQPKLYNCDLFDCYGKPSGAKIAIFNQWLEWAETLENDLYILKDFSVVSYNTNIFTLGITLHDVDNDDLIYLYITPCHHYVSTIPAYFKTKEW